MQEAEKAEKLRLKEEKDKQKLEEKVWHFNQSIILLI